MFNMAMCMWQVNKLPATVRALNVSTPVFAFNFIASYYRDFIKKNC